MNETGSVETLWKNPWVRVAIGLLAFVALIVVAMALSQVLIPLATAFLVAYIFNPVCNWMERRGIRRTFAIALLAMTAAAIIIAIPLFFIPMIVTEADRLVQQARETSEQMRESESPSFFERAEDWLVARLPLENIVSTWGLREVTELDEETPPEQVIAAYANTYIRDNALGFLRSNLRSMTDWGQWAGTSAVAIFSRIGQGLLAIVLFILNVALFGFVAGYLLKDYDRVIEHARDLVPPKRRSKVVQIATDIDAQLQAFFRGQLMVMSILAGFYAVGFLICGVPFAIAIAILGGLFNIVPLIGPLLTYLPVIVLTWMAHGLDWHVIGAVLVILVAQGLEGNVLTPNIVGTQVGLHPVWVILAVIVFSGAFGFVGLLLAVPIAATLKVFVLEAYHWYKASDYYRDRAASA